MNTYNYLKMNTRKLIIAFSLALLPLFGFSQSTFDAFEDMDDVSSVVINKRAFRLLEKVSVDSSDKEAQEYINMIRNLTSLKVFATESASVAAQMKSKVNSYLKSSSQLSELMRVKDKEANVKIYIKEGRNEDHVTELFMFVDGISQHMDGERKAEAVIVSITGDIDLNQISKLTQEMNIQGGEHLKKVKKNK